MTLYSKANLVVGSVASKDSFDRALNGVRFEPDGSTVAGNAKVLVAVEGVNPNGMAARVYPDVGERGSPGDNGVVLEVDHVDEALKNIPKDKRIELQHCAMTKGHDDASIVELTTVSAGGRERRTADRPKRDPYPDWKGVVRKVRSTEDGGEAIRVCVNRTDLIDLLKTIEAACPDKGKDCPVFLEIGQGIVARSVNRDTGQNAIGAINSYNTRGQWLPESDWVRGVFDDEVKSADERPKRVRRKRRVK